ncbi:DUF2267 domain-containing protein [Pseudovibrio axinellae]|nr:DUF2267 domain-containing protein [Pseudovibrio axinellae]
MSGSDFALSVILQRTMSRPKFYFIHLCHASFDSPTLCPDLSVYTYSYLLITKVFWQRKNSFALQDDKLCFSGNSVTACVMPFSGKIVMPMPQEYQLASQQFESFLKDAQETLGLTTRNQTYTSVQAVLLTFRHRLSPEKILRFADALPPVLRAIFVSDWQTEQFISRFGDYQDWIMDVKALRTHHNFSQETAVCQVSKALRQYVDLSHFQATLETLGADAVRYWSIDLPAEGR